MTEKWSHTVGHKPYRVTVYERTPGAVLYARIWAGGSDRRVSLGHRDRDRAVLWAEEQTVNLRKGAQDLPTVARASGPKGTGRVSVRKLLTLRLRYLEEKPERTEGTKADDRRRAKLWERALGSNQDAHVITRAKFERFIRDRRAGAIDARGNRVREADRKPVGARIVEQDARWLLWATRWGSRWQLEDGTYLLQEDPCRADQYQDVIPQEKNPRRPIISEEGYLAMREAAEDHTMEVTWNGRKETRPSYLLELLDLAHETGHRRGALVSLRYVDLKLDRGPHGSILWSDETDKEGISHLVPMSETARRAVNRALLKRPPESLYLFPSGKDLGRHLSPREASRWFREGEDLADGFVPAKDGEEGPKVNPNHVRGMGFHSFRRKFATERVHLPDVAVASLGGWKPGSAVLKEIYQRATPDVLLEALEDRRPLREAM